MANLVNRLRGLNVLYLMGLLLSIGGCNAIFLLEGWLLAGAMGVFLVGQGLAWWSGVGSYYRLLALLIPSVVFISVYTITSDTRARVPAVWRIPEGYSGPVYLFLKEKCGEPSEMEGDYRVYTFPEKGVLYSQADKNYGVDVTLVRFEYVRPDGSLLVIPNFQDTSARAPDEEMLRDSAGQPLFGFPGTPGQGDNAYGRYYLEYAFIGSYRQYLDFLRHSPLPDSLPSDVLEWQQLRPNNCKRGR